VSRIGKAIRDFLSWTTLIGMLPVIVAVLCSGYITYRYNSFLNETRALVRHSLEVTTAIDDVMLDLQDLETGQRGYLITGEEDYLEPFQAARQRVNDDLSELKSLVSDSAGQTASVKTIADLAGKKLTELDRTVEVRSTSGFAAARAIVAEDAGKTTMDAIRREVDVMRAYEASRLSANNTVLRSTENQVILIVGIAVALSLIGRLVGLFLTSWLRARDPEPTDRPA
jgi:methyl-accepting chemotaxis protein